MRFAVLAFLIGLAACSSPGSLNYQPPETVFRAKEPTVAAVQVIDERDEKPNRIATIRGGYGNPLKVMDTVEPVSIEVQKVFTKALADRGMLTDAGPYRFRVRLHTLYANQFTGRNAEINFDLIVLDRADRQIYSDTIKQSKYEFTFFDNGIFASIDTLGKHVQSLLNDGVDRALDKAGLRDALAAQPRSVASLPAT